MNATKQSLQAKFSSEYETLVRDPLFTMYGGVRSEEGKRAYVQRRWEELKRWNHWK
jgi:hypothetical protein